MPLRESGCPLEGLSLVNERIQDELRKKSARKILCELKKKKKKPQERHAVSLSGCPEGKTERRKRKVM